MWGQRLRVHLWTLHITPQTSETRICLCFILHAYTGTTNLLPACPPVSLRRSNNHYRYWNICQLSISYAPCLGLGPDLPWDDDALPRNPYAFGGKDSHLSFRYSYQHSHFPQVHHAFQHNFNPVGTLPPPRVLLHSHSFGSVL